MGAAGQLGREFVTALDDAGVRVVSAGRASHEEGEVIDLLDPEKTRERVLSLRPAVVINAAAYTAVDRAEKEIDAAYAVNAVAPGVLARACREVDALMLHVSTDYVFDGSARRPYKETDPVSPINEYGRTKVAGERAVLDSGVDHLVVRTSGLYTPGCSNFVATMLRLFRRAGTVRVVDDQCSSPTCARNLARSLSQLLTTEAEHSVRAVSGLYHLCAEGETSWYGFAAAIHRRAKPAAVAELAATDTASYAAPAPRPAYSVLDCTRARERLGISLPHWLVQLESVMDEFNAINTVDG